MASVNIEFVASVNVENNRIEKREYVLNQNGDVVEVTTIVPTDETGGVRVSTFKEEISFSLGQTSFSTSNEFYQDSLQVFLNGINITNDITTNSDSSFTIHSSYSNIEPEDYVLFVVYSLK